MGCVGQGRFSRFSLVSLGIGSLVLSVGRFRHNAFRGLNRERERTESARGPRAREDQERERPKSARDLSERTERVSRG